MKKTFLKFAYVGAIALTGMMGFSACQSDSAEEVNPNYDPETNSVKTEFAFNIASNAKQKMTATNTQNGGNFLGMNTMKLFCFDQTPANDHFLGMFDLGSLAASSISSTEPSSKIYTMYLPVGTSDFLFYGAWAAGEGHENGKLTKNFPATVSNTTALSEINFALVPIVANNSTAITGVQTTLLGHLNNILKAKNASGSTWYGTQYLFASGADETTKAAYRPLAVAYKTFIDKLQIRQASSTTFLRSLQDLYNVAKTISNGASTTPGATDAQKTDIQAVADDIIAKIEGTGLFNVPVGDLGADKNPRYTLTYKSTVDATVKNFPMEQGLPAGAAVLTMATPGNPGSASAETSDAFTYTNNGNNVLGQSVTNNIFDITYPSELTYYANSKARVSNGVHVPGDYPKTVGTWDSWTTPSGAADWEDNGTVTARTQAAAMKNNAKYGVAQLVSTVKLASYTMTDNATAITQTNDGVKDYITDVDDQQFTFDADDFKWTGILIGGQAEKLKYNFTTDNTENMNKVIYDNDINKPSGINITTTTSAQNYTLALDNYLADKGTQQTVNVALEIQNNSGKDFYGKDGIIAAGATFYLVGQLVPAGTITWTGVYDNHPGYNKTRVFIQDFKTIANFTISADGLKNAYSSIPDLRSTQMLFGLSVDLTWKAGLTFNVDL